jgi:hypothetical protein
MAFVSCRECGSRVSNLAELCPDCGYPNSPVISSESPALPDASTSDSTSLREYRWIQVLGAAVIIAGIAAAVADSPLASLLAIGVGFVTFVVGFMGAWRHGSTDDK